MARVRIDNSIGTLGASLTSAGTTITFASAPSWATLAKGHIIALVLDPPGATPNGSYEVVYVTAYTSGATTATILRGQEGTTGVAHSNGATWMVGPTSSSETTDPVPVYYTSDFTDASSMAANATTAPLNNILGNATIDTTNQQIKNTDGSDNRIRLELAYLGPKAWRDCAVQAKYVPSSTTPDFALCLGEFNVWAQFSGGSVQLKSFEGGTNNIGGSQGRTLTAGSTYWMRLESRMNFIFFEVWTKDPSTRAYGDVPLFAWNGNININGSVQVPYGRPGIRLNTNGDLVKELKFWHLPEVVA